MLPVALCLAVLASCGEDKKDTSSSMPAATNWSGSGAPSATNSALNTGRPGDPHAGLDMGGADPHAGLDMGGADPHAGLDMGGADPHAGLDMGGGNPGGLMAPDPNRTVDPKMFVAGQLEASVETAALMTPGSIIFLSVRPINKATGDVLGQPLAVERVDLKALPIAFHLSGANSMVAGTEFAGDVEVYARLDHDGEASSVEPGDIEGRVQATIPAEGLRLILDTVVK